MVTSLAYSIGTIKPRMNIITRSNDNLFIVISFPIYCCWG